MNESVNAVAVADFRFRNNEKECFAGIKVDEDGLFGESIEWNWMPENLVKINQNSKINDDNEQNKKNKKKSKKKDQTGKIKSRRFKPEPCLINERKRFICH